MSMNSTKFKLFRKSEETSPLEMAEFFATYKQYYIQEMLNNKGNQSALKQIIFDFFVDGIRCGITFDEICSDILRIGIAVNKEEIAQKLIKEAVDTKHKITKQISSNSLLLLEWIDPYFSAGHWIPEQIEMAGFTSSIGKKGEKSRQLSAEEIIKKNPDYIGLICCGYNLEENILFSQKIYQDERINHLSAIKEERVFAFDSNSYFSRPSLRILEGVKQLKKAILQIDKKFHCKRR